MLLTSKKLITKKLFYKKWMYKVVIRCGGIAQLRRRGLDYVLNATPVRHGSPYALSISHKVITNRLALCEIAGYLEKHLSLGEHQIRVESDTCAVFTNTRLIADNLLKDIEKYVVEYHEPENNKLADFLSSNKNKIVCNQLPHDHFRYKIYFKNGEVKNGRILKGFLTWADKMNNKIHVPAGTRKVISGEDYQYFYGHYFYAKDQQMASMASMMISENLHRTEEYVLKSELI